MTKQKSPVTQQIKKIDAARKAARTSQELSIKKIGKYLRKNHSVTLNITENNKKNEHVVLQGSLVDGKKKDVKIRVDVMHDDGRVVAIAAISTEGGLFGWNLAYPDWINLTIFHRGQAMRQAAAIISATKATCTDLFGFDEALVAAARLMVEAK